LGVSRHGLGRLHSLERDQEEAVQGLWETTVATSPVLSPGSLSTLH
jgi:hypothetical protein